VPNYTKFLNKKYPIKGKNKYGATRTQNAEGVWFASKAECKRDGELQLLAKAGKISSLNRQPRFVLNVNSVKICTYVADWQYTEGNYSVVEDRKGVLTAAFKIKWALAKALYPDLEFRLS
jgi:hypothetical protein